MKFVKLMLLAALLMGLTATAAFAIAPHPDLRSELPPDIQEFFSAEKYEDDLIMHDREIGNYYFVTVRSGEKTNTVFGFKKTDDGWKYWMKNQSAIPQGGYCVQINPATGFENALGDTFTLPTLCFERSDPEYEYIDCWVYYSLSGNVWQLEEIHDVDRDARVLFDSGKLTYYGGNDALRRIGSVYATVQRDIRYLDIAALPLDYHDAKARLTAAPTLPASTELQAENIKFTGGQKYEVYSAPSVLSWRGAEGKAVVSTNSWIQVFGVEDGFAMIHYSIDAEHYRIGYIAEEALPRSADVAALNFAPIPAWTAHYTITMTDDPFYSGRSIATLPPMTEVTWLASIGSWAYVEVASPQLMRGFIPQDAVFTDLDQLHQAMTTPVPGADK